jgi:hypothetical protein
MFRTQHRQREAHSLLNRDVTPSVRATVYGTDGNSDTYITNRQAVKPVAVYEIVGSKFIDIPDESQEIATTDESPTINYSGGAGGNLLYRSREYLRIGGNTLETYRAVIILEPTTAITSALSTVSGYTAGAAYSVGNATLTLSLLSGATGAAVEAVLMPLGVTVDASVSWYKPSEGAETTWANAGGDTEPAAAEIVSMGVWSGSNISFDITPFLNIWNTSEKQKLAIIIKAQQLTGGILQFHSWESQSSAIGGGNLLNCRFLAGGESNSTSTEGVRVLVQTSGSTATGVTATVSLADERTTAVQQWNSFGASVSTGSTFTFFSPDAEQGLVLGSVTCTLSNKVSDNTGSPLVVTGISLGGITAYYTTAELSGVSTLPSETGIIEISNPTTQTLSDITGLTENQNIYVDYRAGSATNNSRSFTVKFVADETTKQNRARIYLNETPVSENRSGLNTRISVIQTKPTLTMDLLLG